MNGTLGATRWPATGTPEHGPRPTTGASRASSLLEARSPDVGRLTVVYDPTNAFCTWCRDWVEAQALLVPVRFTPTGSPEAQTRLGVLGAGAELVVVAEDGRAWTGAAAFVLCLWATARHRDLACTVHLPAARMGAEAFFHAITANRATLDRLLAPAPATIGLAR